MTNIEAVRNWLRTCPLLKEGRLGVDFLPRGCADLFGGQRAGAGNRQALPGWFGGEAV